jgi:hypothetical protein
MVMSKGVKFVLALLLIPFCIGSVKALGHVLDAMGRAELVWVALLAGAACWLVIFLMLPKPMRVYVIGHEVTHVLWAWLFGGRVKRFRASARGGQVVVTRNNFLITLSPYFCPLYVIVVVVLFALGHLCFGWERYLVWLHLVVGAAYAFHLTLTWQILQTRKSDITSQGYVFSAVVIFLGNVLVLLLGLPLLTSHVSVMTSLGWWITESGQVVLRWRSLF